MVKSAMRYMLFLHKTVQVLLSCVLVWGKICAFGGPSGVGKSSTINAIDSSVELRTGAVSEKIGRGKHTTRYAQLLPLMKVILLILRLRQSFARGLEEDMAVYSFREFAEYEHGCRFCPCTHTHEPVCGVKAGCRRQVSAPSRYESYLNMREEIKELQEREERNDD